MKLVASDYNYAKRYDQVGVLDIFVKRVKHLRRSVCVSVRER
jgi:hypothetical protein